jgi:hypothetical protein
VYGGALVPISQSQFSELLGLPSKNPVSHETSYLDGDPGNTELVASQLIAKGKDCWESTSIVPAPPQKTKFIFCNYLLSECAPDATEVQFFSMLISSQASLNYEVYLWPDPSTPFSNCKPINNSTEFWEQRHNAHSSKEQEVKKVLAQQFIATEGVIVLDYTACIKLLNKYQDRYKYRSDYLNLSSIAYTQDAVFEKLMAGIEISQIQEIKFKRPPDERETRRCFPGSWHSFFELNNTRITRTILHSTSKKLEISDENELCRTSDDRSVVSLQNATLANLTIHMQGNKPRGRRTLDLSQCFALKALEIFTMPTCPLEQLLLPENCLLEYLKIISNVIPINPIQPLLNLKTLILNIPYPLNEFDHGNLSFHKQLENFEFCGYFFNLKKINLEKYSSLKRFVFSNAIPGNTIPEINLPNTLKDFIWYDIKNKSEFGSQANAVLKQLTELETLEISGIKLSTSQLSCHHSLKVFKCNSITDPQGTKKIDLSLLTALEVVEIVNTDFEDIQLPINDSLKHLKFYSDELEWEAARSISSAIKKCKNLETLVMIGGDFTDFNFDDLACKKTVKRLRLGVRCPTINLSEFTALESLEIERNIDDILYNSDLTLTLPSSNTLKSVNIKNLTRRSGYNEKNITLLNLKNSTALEKLVLNCGRNTLSTESDLTVLSGLKNLKEIVIKTASDVELDFSEHSELRILDIRNAKKVGLRLANCPRLVNLDINAESLDIKTMDGCPSLNHVKVEVSSPHGNSLGPIYQLENFPYIKLSVPEPELKAKSSGARNFNISKPVINHPTAENIELNQKNEASPVAIIPDNRSDGLRIDSKTGLPTDPTQAAKQARTVVFEAQQQPIDKRLYCTDIWDQVLVSENHQLTFRSSKPHSLEKVDSHLAHSNANSISQWRNDARQNANLACGHSKMTLPLPKDGLPLTTLHPNDTLLGYYCEPSGTVELFFDKNKQQYWVKNKSERPSNEIEIYYLTQPVEPQGQLIKGDPNTLLPPELVEALTKNLSELIKNQASSSNKKRLTLNFLSDTSIALDKKMELLKNYCSNPLFKNEALDPTTEYKNDIDTLLAIIMQQKGACRHRCYAFMVLARFLGVPVNIVSNGENHTTVIVPYQNQTKNDTHWRQLDLGGAPVIDLTPIERRVNVFEKEPIVNSTQPAISQPKTEKNATPTTENYRQQFRKVAEAKQLHLLNELLDNSERLLKPVIGLTASQTPYAVDHSIRQQLVANGFDVPNHYFYIDNADDFDLYLNPFKLVDGKRTPLEGPLLALIKSREKGILVVNWANFKGEQLPSYQSILDTQSTLSGHSLQNFTVIGLTNPSVKACSSFLSRCEHYQLHSDFFSQPPTETQQDANSLELIEVDLFGRSNWWETLTGQIILEGKRITLNVGPLIQAIREKRPITIFNPPQNNKDFELLLHRVCDQQRLFYNGEWLEVGPGVIVKTQNKQHASELANVQVIKEIPEDFINNKAIYLNICNWHMCFKLLDVNNETKQARTELGLLEQYQIEQDFFYITSFIPKGEWERLLAHIKANYPEKEFRFVLAPGVRIEGTEYKNTITTQAAKIIKPEAILFNTEPVIISNDPDYLTDQLAKEYQNVLIVDITPQTTFSDLVAKTTITGQKDSQEFDFSWQEQGVLQALKAGRTVILNGELSPTLYHNLLPLLTDPAHAYCNGKRVELGGRLIAVLPKTHKLSLITNHAECNYNPEDYKETFGPEDQVLLEKIDSFYTRAQQLPHTGIGRPEAFTLSHKRLTHMVKALKEHKLHPNNPIKGLFLYDYPKDSEDYAYLNVVAKYYFYDNQSSSVNTQKLNALFKRYKIDIKNVSDLKTHVWKILNCLNGAELKELLGPDLSQTIDSHGSPALKQEVLEKFAEQMAKQSQSTPSTSNRGEKQLQQLHTLLKDDKEPCIILQGQPGVGKTYTIEQLKKDEAFCVFEGQQAILEWLEEVKNGKINILFLDEANMALPGTWDFLKGLSRDKKTIWYQNKEYQLTDHHKIVATGNPVSFPNRYFHDFFQHDGNTLLFQIPDDAFLKTNILEPRLQQHKGFADKLLTAYHLIQQHNPLGTYSIRDLENLAGRFICLNDGKTGAHQALLQACIGEFAGMIQDRQKRQTFVNELIEKLEIVPASSSRTPSPIIKITDKISTTREKGYLVEAIKQNLKLREQIIVQADQNMSSYYKHGMLTEGDSGIGKSTLIQAVLMAAGFVKSEPKQPHLEDGESTIVVENSQNTYYVINVGSKNVIQILINAYYEGAVVILDELNLDEKTDALVNDLLDGKDPSEESEKVEGKKVPPRKKKPGFMVISSQNPSYFESRKSLSPALFNRLHFLYMDNFTREELIALAEKKDVPEPAAFVDAYLEEQAKYPEQINMRTFYNLLVANGKDLQHEARQEAQPTPEQPELRQEAQPDIRESRISVKR